ncbi:MAG: DUF6230 family protein [Tuberibacillus sp.]
MELGQSIVLGHTIKKRFWAAFVAGFLFLAGLIATFGVTGTAFAMPLTGIGTFNVSFDELRGNGFKMYGALNQEKGPKGQEPVFVNKINNATIKGLKITKDISIPGLGTLRAHIVSDSKSPVQITGLTQNATVINGDAVFTNMDITERYSDDPSQEFSQGADTITLKNGNLETVYLFQDKVTLPGLKVTFEYLGK